MEYDKDVPLIMGHPYLATGQTLIDVVVGEMIVRVNNEQVAFKIFKTMKYSESTYDCFEVNMIHGAIAKI